MKIPMFLADRRHFGLVELMFFGLYSLISVATFRHTALGFASLEGGNVVWGALSALAVDMGMLLSASALRQAFRWPYFIGLVVSALASTYTQLLYSMFTAGVVEVAPGAAWLGSTASSIIDARVVLLPALLPLLSITYAFAAKTSTHKVDFMSEVEAIKAQTTNKRDRARRIWELSENGHGDLTVEDVAALAECHSQTARRAQPTE